MNVIIEKIPKELGINNKKISFNIFAEKFIDYMEDLEDIKKVKDEIKNNSESFDYSVIRWSYV